nr:hypothetical protein [Tanacetum cinerariifolium]
MLLGITYYCWIDVNDVEGENCYWEVQLQALVDGKKVFTTESTVRKDLQLDDAKGVDCLPNAAIFERLTLMGKTQRNDIELPQTSGPTTNIADETINEKMDDSLVRAVTTASTLEAEQDSGNINKTQSKATPNEPGSQGTSLGGGPSVKDSLKLKEMMELYTNLQNMVLDLETTKTTQAMEIKSLKRRVKKFEKKKRSRTHKLKILYKGWFNDQEDAKMLFDVADYLRGKEVFVSQEVPLKEVSVVDEVNAVSTATTTTTTINDITLAKALMETKSVKPKADKEQAHTPTVSSQQPLQVKVQDKGKGKMVKPDPVNKLSKKDQLMLDEELAFKLHANEEEEDEERLARKKAQQIKEVNIAWDDIQANIDANYKFA